MREELLAIYEGTRSNLVTRCVIGGNELYTWILGQGQFKEEVIGYVEETLFPSR
jgi:hypothetical protein